LWSGLSLRYFAIFSALASVFRDVLGASSLLTFFERASSHGLSSSRFDRASFRPLFSPSRRSFYLIPLELASLRSWLACGGLLVGLVLEIFLSPPPGPKAT